MILALRRRLGRCLTRPDTSAGTCAGADETTAEERHRVVEALRAARASGDRVTLREVHRLVGLPQPAVLRCVRHLAQAGIVRVEEMEHDPLAGEVALV